jgi:hypothetical protein
MTIGRLYFIEILQELYATNITGTESDDTTASSKWMHRSYLKTTAIKIYSNEKC